MNPAVLVTGLGGVLGLLALAAAVWRRRWVLWLVGYLLVVIAITAALLRGGT